jgi:hypothetical protein
LSRCGQNDQFRVKSVPVWINKRMQENHYYWSCGISVM